MKGNGKRGAQRTARLLALGVALTSFSLGSAAQSSLHWPGNRGQMPTVTMPPRTDLPPQPQYRPPVSRPLPPQGFDVAYFESLAQQLVANQRIPGLAMAIVKDGRVLSARGYGVTDVRDAEPIDAHTVFRLASLSKPFASTITGLLVADGALRWDSKVTQYLPSLRFSDPQAAQELTVRDVLSQRTGLTRNTYDRDLEGNMLYPALVQKLAYAPMRCRPGQCYSYQNIAYSLVGDVVHGATGQYFDEAVARRIFKPLGMTDASYGLAGIEASPRWAKPHIRAGGGWASVRPKPTYYRVAPAAGVNASISDMAQWLLAQTGHRPDVLPAEVLDTVHSAQVSTPTELKGSAWRRERLTGAWYGLGWRVYDYAGHRMVFHGGAVQGYRGAVAMLPERDLAVAILWNSESALPSGLLPTILDRALGMAPRDWLQIDPQEQPSDDQFYAGGRPGGADAGNAVAAPH